VVDDVDTTTDDTADEIVDEIGDELADVDVSGIDIPDPDATPPGPERLPVRRKPPVVRKPGAPPSKARED
jgi:hypothetical protein